MPSRLRFGALFASLLLAFSLVSIDYADAQRRGGFGSRGARTFQSAPPTSTAPNAAAPINRTATPQTQAARPGTAAAQAPRRGLFGGLGGGILGGLVAGGLFGLLLGSGFGGMGGFLALIVQLLLVGLGAMLLIRLFRGRSATSQAGNASGLRREAYAGGEQTAPGGAGFRIPAIGSGAGAARGTPAQPSDAIGVTQNDLDGFERLLIEIKSAFAHEDYLTLRGKTTPEVMGHLSEELGQNATNGRKNDISDVRLLQGDVAEAWNENGRDYATVAMRYESVDVLRDRASGTILSGESDHLGEKTELWTFTRERGAEWKLSALQEAS